MVQVSACPDERQLQSILQGKASPEVQEAFADHLEQCPDCAEKLDQSLVGDTLMEALQSQATMPDHPSDSAVKALVTGLLQQGPAAPPDVTVELGNLALEPAVECDLRSL